MERLNARRFLGAGLVAGLAVNVFDGTLYTVVLGADAAAAMERLGLQEPGPAGMMLYALAAFVIGFITVWLYTGMRARLGPGPATAVKTGVAVWAVAYLLPALDLTIEGIYTTRMLVVAAAFTLVSMSLVALAGAWVYRGSS
jgi:hypothetical protein